MVELGARLPQESSEVKCLLNDIRFVFFVNVKEDSDHHQSGRISQPVMDEVHLCVVQPAVDCVLSGSVEVVLPELVLAAQREVGQLCVVLRVVSDHVENCLIVKVTEKAEPVESDVQRRWLEVRSNDVDRRLLLSAGANVLPVAAKSGVVYLERCGSWSVTQQWFFDRCTGAKSLLCDTGSLFFRISVHLGVTTHRRRQG